MVVYHHVLKERYYMCVYSAFTEGFFFNSLGPTAQIVAIYVNNALYGGNGHVSWLRTTLWTSTCYLKAATVLFNELCTQIVGKSMNPFSAISLMYICRHPSLALSSLVHLDADNIGQHLNDLRLTLGSRLFTVHLWQFHCSMSLVNTLLSSVILWWYHLVQTSSISSDVWTHRIKQNLVLEKNERAIDCVFILFKMPYLMWADVHPQQTVAVQCLTVTRDNMSDFTLQKRELDDHWSASPRLSKACIFLESLFSPFA